MQCRRCHLPHGGRFHRNEATCIKLLRERQLELELEIRDEKAKTYKGKLKEVTERANTFETHLAELQEYTIDLEAKYDEAQDLLQGLACTLKENGYA